MGRRPVLFSAEEKKGKRRREEKGGPQDLSGRWRFGPLRNGGREEEGLRFVCFFQILFKQIFKPF
jgi:hypothetical protein